MKGDRRYRDVRDADLACGTLIGDLGCFDELARRYRGAVAAVAEQITGKRDLAQDIVQEALLLAFRALPQLADPSKFGPWLLAITRHRAQRVFRRDSRLVAIEQCKLDALLAEHSECAYSHQALETAAERSEARVALEQLPESLQTVAHLRYIEEWQLQRIADFVSLPLTTVKWRLHEARRIMRRALQAASEDNNVGQRLEQANGNPTSEAAPERPGATRRALEPDGRVFGRRAAGGASLQRCASTA